MSVVEFKINELEKLIDKTLSDELLKDKIPMMGCDIEYLDKEKVRYEIFPNRPDLLSQEGFARALKYFLDLDKGLKKYEVNGKGVKLNKKRVKARPKITAAIVKNVEITEEILKSLMQLQEKLHKTIGRNREKVAIGIHDLDKVNPPFTYKQVKPGKFKFNPLGCEEELTLKEIKEKHEKGKYANILKGHDKWPVIVDSNNKTLSFPPVINSQNTEVTKETRNLFIDVTGTHQETLEKTLNIIVTTLAERGGEIHKVKIKGLGERPNLEIEEIDVDLDYVNKMLGVDFTELQFEEHLKRMGYGFKEKRSLGYDRENTVLIPPYRIDIMHPIDIVEDIAIKHGYDEFKPEIPEIATIGNSDEMKERESKLKEILIGLGYQEVKNMVLTNTKNQFEKMNRKKPENKLIELKNPLDKKHTVCRSNIMSQLLKNLSNNQHVSYPQRIFEVGKCLELEKTNNNHFEAKTKIKLSLAKSDTKVNYNEATSLLESIMRNLDQEYKLIETENPSFIKGRRAKIVKGKDEIGSIGEIHPKVLNNWRIEKPVIAMELDLDKLL